MPNELKKSHVSPVDAAPDDTVTMAPGALQLARRWLPSLRFSLRTLLIFMLLIGSGTTLWLNWSPWALERVLSAPPNESIEFLAISHRGDRLLSTSSLGTDRVWNLEHGEEQAVLRGHKIWSWCAAFSPDDRYVATVSDAATARIWDAESGRMLFVLKGHTSQIWTGRYSHAGDKLVTASRDGTARIWNTHDGTVLAVLKHGKAVTSAMFSADDQYVLTNDWNYTARLWDANTGNEIRVITGNGADCLSATFSHDGRMIVTTSKDMTATVWETSTGRQLAVLRGHTGIIYSARFSPDDRK